ncbi:MAG: hypothetical protein J5379_09880 [Clostridiales bacterium]|nr:hypothetical protein [Clostridiales bacterium]
MLSTQIVRKGLKMRSSAISMARRELQKNPPITIGWHLKKGVSTEVLRYHTDQDGRVKYREISTSTAKGQKFLPIARRNAELRKLIRDLKNEVQSLLDMFMIEQEADSNPSPDEAVRTGRFSYEEWCALEELNDMSIPNGYRHGRRIFRSKSEMLIAQILEELGLPYKYEPVIQVIGNQRWPDFAVYCPEIGRYFFIEHLGMMGKTSYRMDNLEKLEAYEKASIRDGVDILYTMEFVKGGFNTLAVKGKILGLLLAQA